MNQQDSLSNFSRHTPRLLRRQLIHQLTEQFLGKESVAPEKLAKSCAPSIQRLHATLLRVEIVGFSALSLTNNAEDFRASVNEFHSKLLEIVERYGGDVVQFSGESLTIVWESMAIDEDRRPDELSKLSLTEAAACAQEIAVSCSNHKVEVKSSRRSDSFRDSARCSSPGSSRPGTPHSFSDCKEVLRASTPSRLRTAGHADAKMKTKTSPKAAEDAVFLNVRLTISSGLMAGIDIGSDNRWEYFLVGEPVTKVTEAVAGVGEVVLCGAAHSLLHPGAGAAKISRMLTRVKSALFRTNSTLEAAGPRRLSCGCTQMPGGHCVLAPAAPDSQEKPRLKPIRQGTADTHHLTSNDESCNSASATQQLLDSIRTDTDDAFAAHQALFAKEFTRLRVSLGIVGSDATDERLQPAFADWVQRCLADDLARHVHPVMRSEHAFSDALRGGSFLRVVEEHMMNPPVLALPSPTRPLAPVRMFSGGSKAGAPAPLTLISSFSPADTPRRGSHNSLALDSPRSVTPSLDGLRRGSNGSISNGSANGSIQRPSPNRLPSLGGRRDTSSLLRTSLTHGAAATSKALAEVRAVTLMSLSIFVPELELLVDGTRHKRTGGGCHFLGRTVNETCADQMLLSRLQSLLEFLCDTFARFGGQLKQFVVEGKRVLCEGSFGLRGSVSDDNATASLEAAHEVSEYLRELGMQCSIGVTLGRTFCGLVGSSGRHQFALMGPSVRLSARLMQQAPAGGMLCDAEVRQRDQTLGFRALSGSIEGVSVEVYAPVFPEPSDSQKGEHSTHNPSFVVRPSVRSSNARPSGAAHSIEAALVLRQLLKPKEGLYGRDAEWTELVNHLFAPLVTQASSAINTTHAKVTSNRGARAEPIFDYLQPSRCAGVTGGFGIGKSSLVSSMVERLAVVARCNEGCNIHLFKARLDNFRHDTPFSAWKPIIVAMLTRLYRASDAVNSRQQTTSIQLESIVDHAMSLLPSTLQNLRPLFAFLGVLPHEDASLSRLSAAQKVAHCIELLVAVIQIYTITCNSLAVISFDNIGSMDRPSMCLLLEVCVVTHGVVVLFAGRTSKDNDALHALKSALDQTEDYLMVDLPPMSSEAVTSLVRDVFRQKRTEAATVLCDKAFEASGGNPFYAFEIAKSASEHQNQTWDASLTAVHSIRVEEVICHRFDQLKASAQSLLKIAAVACSNGAAVTMDLLSELVLSDLEQGDEDSCDLNHHFKLASALQQLLSYESFLRVAGQADSQKSVTVEAILEGRVAFEFAIPLEQSTIYGLLMEDQKYALHEYTAAYLRARNCWRATATDLQEEAHHWQDACVFGRAMTCYFRAYQAEVDAERRSGWLSRAYSIYLHRKENTELIPDPVGISQSHLSALFDDAFHHEGKSPCRSSADSAFVPVLTLERVFQIFEGDSDLLSTGVETLLAVASERTRLSEDCQRTQLLLEDAMQYVLLTSGRQATNHRSVLSRFGLKDFWPLCFRVLSAYVLNDAQSSHVSVEYFRKVGFVATQFVALTKREGHCRHHLIQALCVECMVLFKAGDSKKAKEVVEELHSLYSSEAHSALLIDSYGCDAVPCVFVTAASDLLLSANSDVFQVDSLVQQCLAFVRLSSSVVSVAHCLLPLIAHLSHRSRYLDAYEALTAYDKLAKRDGSRVDDLLPRRVVQLYFEWLSKRIAHASVGSRSSVDPWMRTQADLCSGGLATRHQNEIELVLADLYVLRAAEVAAEAVRSCHLCGVHLTRVLRNKNCSVVQHSFNKASAIKLALDLLSKAPTEAKADCLSELRRVFSVAVLSDLKVEAHQSHLEALCGDLDRLQHTLYESVNAFFIP